MMKFSFKIPKSAGPVTSELIDQVLEEVAVELSNQLKLEVPVDEGRLRQSISILERSGRHFTVGTNLDYAGFVATGTEPHYPPFEPIQGWCHRKGIENPWAVWHKIGEEGTEPNPYDDRAINNVQNKFPKIVNRAERQVE